ncbi:MAG: YccF domain-containing protein [Chitinophagales bacterium]|nr:YccF domain-containing protein [Chitinophagales bacterium]
MNFLGNLVWLIFGGFLAALCYFFGGLVLCCTVIGIPWGLQCFKIAGFILMPFGLKVVSDSSNSGCLATVANIVWIICGGLASAIIHVLMGVLLSITIIGIPWGRQHFKLVELSLMPFGKRVVVE